LEIVVAALSSSSSPLTIAFGLIICSSTTRHVPSHFKKNYYCS
jgi:hypothetical protein